MSQLNSSAIRVCNIEELPEQFSSGLTKYAVLGAVASGDFAKFKFVIEHSKGCNNCGNSFDAKIIKEASKNSVSETSIIQMIEYMIDKGMPININTVKRAVEAEYFELAQYLLSHDQAEIKALDEFDVAKYDGLPDSNPLISFEWLLNHGASIDKKLIGTLLCKEHLPFRVVKFEDNYVKDITDILVKTGFTTEERLAEVKQKCSMVVEAIHSKSVYGSITKSLGSGGDINDIKFLIENGADLRWDNLKDLIIHNDPEITQYVIGAMIAQKLEISDYSKENIAFYINNQHNPSHCTNDKIIADYAGITGKVDWSYCEADL
jgi:hypothetical protein